MGRSQNRAPDREPHRSQEILRWVEKWRTLKAWEHDLTEVQVSVPGSYNHGVYGACTVSGQKLRVYYSPEGIAVDLSTLLHEMAHADTPHEHLSHGPVWRASLVRAVLEVTGTNIMPSIRDCQHYLTDNDLLRSQVDYYADKAVREWWRRTGNDLAYDLGRGALHKRREWKKFYMRSYLHTADFTEPVLRFWDDPPHKVENTYVPLLGLPGTTTTDVPLAQPPMSKDTTDEQIARVRKLAELYQLPERYLTGEDE